MCSARRLGRSAAAPPAEGAVVARADPTSQVQPTCLPSRCKTCRGSQTFNPHPSPCFRFSSNFLVHARRCPGNLERGFMKKLINAHSVILQKQEELLARSAIDKNSIPDKCEALVVYRQSASLLVPKKDCLRTSWSSLPVVGSTRPRLPVRFFGNPILCYLNIHVNIYNEYSDKYSFKYFHEYL